MFKEMEKTFEEQVFSFVGSIDSDAVNIQAETSESRQTLVTSHAESSELGDKRDLPTNKIEDVGRNDPCPCGAINPSTGEVYKYKKCGLINAPQHRKSLVN